MTRMSNNCLQNDSVALPSVAFSQLKKMSALHMITTHSLNEFLLLAQNYIINFSRTLDVQLQRTAKSFEIFNRAVNSVAP